MANPQRLRIQDHLGTLKRFTVHGRLETLLQDASAQDATDVDVLDRLLREEVTVKSET
jgi:hypothetical protein